MNVHPSVSEPFRMPHDSEPVGDEPPTHPQTVVALDLEGVLVPEIWIAVAEETGIDDLRRTTRDEPDYDVLMRQRLEILERESLSLSRIAAIIDQLGPLEGAADFLAELRSLTQVIILSDTFEQFAAPLMRQLGHPTIMCHRLVVRDDRIIDYRLRQQNPKQRAVEALRSLCYRVIAAGDSYNDTTMLMTADVGVLFRAPERVRREFPQFAACDEYSDLMAMIRPELSPQT